MNLLKVISSHRLASLAIGTVLLQASVVLTAYALIRKNGSPPLGQALGRALSQGEDLNSKTSQIEVIKEESKLPHQDNSETQLAKIKENKQKEIESSKQLEQQSSQQDNRKVLAVKPPENTKSKDIENSKTKESEAEPLEKIERTISYEVTSGDTLSKIWLKNGCSTAGSLSAADAFKKAGVPLSALRLGEKVKLTLSPEGDIKEFRKKLSDGKTLILKGSSKTGYTYEMEESKIAERERTVSYPIFNSFSASAHQVSVPMEVIDDLVDLFSSRIDFRRDLQPGDSFTVIYTERSSEDGEVLMPGPIKAVSIETGGKLLAAVRHVGADGKERFFNESGELIGDYFLRYPLKFTRISSIFSTSRFHPILKINRPHNGVDFAAPTGTPVRTIGDGVVEFAGWANGSGNVIKIRHCDRYSTSYSHLSRISPEIRRGAQVTRGAVIGNVGMTGLATAPHLHFSLYDKAKFIDPMTSKLPVSPPSGGQIPGVTLVSAMKALEQQHNLLRLASLIGIGKSSKV